MPVTILVDDSDDAPCNLRCFMANGAAYCTRYGQCPASCVHGMQALAVSRVRDREVFREELTRSDEGGHVRTRWRVDARTQSVVEDVELFCRTLKFESLTVRDHAGGCNR